MVVSKYYQSVGFTQETIRLLEEAKKSLVLLDVLGRSPSQSDVMNFLVRHGYIRLIELDEKEEAKRLERGIVN